MSHPPTTDDALPTIFASRDEASDITFAVELKFLVRQPLAQVRAKYGPQVRPFVAHRPQLLRESMTDAELRLQQDTWDAVARCLDRLPGIHATTSHQVKTVRRLDHTDFWTSHWIVYKANSATPPYLTYRNEDPNLPELDQSHPDYHTYHWTPVEICSPILSWQQYQQAATNNSCSSSPLSRVLTALRQNFDLVANESTETHIHLGRHDGNFYSLPTLQRLASLFWLAEPLLRGVKDPASPNFHHHYTWSYAWRDTSRIALALALDDNSAGRHHHHHQHYRHQHQHHRIMDDWVTGSPHAFDDFLARLDDGAYLQPDDSETQTAAAAAYLDGDNRQALRAIWRAATHRELGALLRGPARKHRRLGFNFHALEQEEAEAGYTSPRTIEVRFLEGFVDEEVVEAWVRLFGALVTLAADPDEEDDYYDAVAFLLDLPQDWPLDVQFGAFMGKLGPVRAPREVWEPLKAVIKLNYGLSR